MNEAHKLPPSEFEKLYGSSKISNESSSSFHGSKG